MATIKYLSQVSQGDQWDKYNGGNVANQKLSICDLNFFLNWSDKRFGRGKHDKE